MEVDVVPRRSVSAAIKTYSKRRVEQLRKPKRQFQDLATTEVKPGTSLESYRATAEGQNRSTEDRRLVDKNLLENNIEPPNKIRRLQDPAPSLVGRKDSIEQQHESQTTGDCKHDCLLSDPVQPTTASPQGTNGQPGTGRIKRASIQNYFKPVPKSSTPITFTNSSSPNLRNSVHSESQAPSSTPPTSPTLTPSSPDEIRWKSYNRPRRRLMTKVSFPAADMDLGYNDDFTVRFKYDNEPDPESYCPAVDKNDKIDYSREKLDERKEMVKCVGSAEDQKEHEGLMDILGSEGWKTGEHRLTDKLEYKKPPIKSLLSGQKGNSNEKCSRIVLDADLCDGAGPGSAHDGLVNKPILIPGKRVTKEDTMKTKKWRPRRDHKYIQTTISTLTIPVHDECNKCGFYYNTTLEEERKTHKYHCEGARDGKLPKTELSKIRLKTWIDGTGFEHSIWIVDREKSDQWKKYAEKALQISYTDLAGWEVCEEQLWSKHTHARAGYVPRYKVYIHTINTKIKTKISTKVLGVVLAESIDQGGPYYKGRKIFTEQGRIPDVVTATLSEEQEYVSLDLALPVLVSIDRIWVHEQYRKKGFATQLIDTVRETFVKGIVVSKRQLAFSLPTVDGHAFATSYCRDTIYDRKDRHGFFIKSSEPSAKFLCNPKDFPFLVEGGKLVENGGYLHSQCAHGVHG